MTYKSLDEMPAFISIPETAQFLGITKPTLYKLIARDPSFPILSIGKRRLVPVNELKAWITENCTRFKK